MIINPRTVVGMGAIGELVRTVQHSLIQSGCTLQPDGVYGESTCQAVKSFQSANSLTATGNIEEATWRALFNRPLPSAGERCLYLTAAFEGHGFELAVGDFDGALLTWGIVGFTMKSGEVQKIIVAIKDKQPELLKQAFGAHQDELLRLMTASADFQTGWARAHTLASGALAEPWRTMFARFGAIAEVQAEQVRRARENYLGPAIRTAKRLGFTSELGLALCFDIHVQNGSVSAQVLSRLEQDQAMPELQRRTLLANSVADAAGKWADDVRARKLTIATGAGTVHGHHYVLENWGLSANIMASELGPAIHASTARAFAAHSGG